MASLGQELKRERELRSISLKDIAEQTKIGVRSLQALEDDRLDLLPGKFLTKAILRAYAKALGMDEDRIMNKFHEETLSREWASKLAERPRPLLPRREPHWRPRIAPFWIILAVVAIAVLASVYFFFIDPRGSSESPAAAVQAQAEPAAEDPSFEFPELPPVVKADQISASEPLRLEFEFHSATWMHVTADGALVLEGTRNAGTRETCEARTEVVLQTGNAGGFRLRINGRTVRPLGQPGKVLTDVRIRRDNLGQFLEPEK